MFKQLRRKLDEKIKKSEVFNKELENIKKNQAEMKNTRKIHQKESKINQKRYKDMDQQAEREQ